MKQAREKEPFEISATRQERGGTPPLHWDADFVAKLGHELRTPLTAILGYTEILKLQAKQYLPKEQYHQLEIVERSGHAMLRLISAVLDWSRLEAGRIEIEAQRFDVKDVFQGLVETMLPMAAAKGLGFGLAFPEQAVAEFSTDPHLLRQVFNNLVTNAIKYTERGGVTVTVSCSAHELKLVVVDTGPGITASEHHRVFEEFHRVTPGVKEGSGLGLAITRGLVEILGGKISLESELGNGCRFEVRLPPLPVARSDTAQELNLPFSPTARPARVLVVDDDPDNRNLIRSFPEGEGMSVKVLDSGRNCLDTVLSESPDLVLMDMMMPEVDGFEATRRLRQIRTAQELPIIGLSALTASETHHRALAAGCNLCLTKPLDFRQLLLAIHQCLGPLSTESGF